MDYFQGDRGRLLGKAEWGSGIVEADSCRGKVRVRFREAGRKPLSLKHAKLMRGMPMPPPSGVLPEPLRSSLPEREV